MTPRTASLTVLPHALVVELGDPTFRSLLTLALLGAPCGAQTPLATWRVVEEARSGLDGAAGALEGPGAIAVAPNGTVFVAQRRAAAVHVYRPDGSFAQAIGREGSGPGEIRSLDAVGLLGDSLWVADANLQRLTFFTLDGKFLGSVRVSLPPRPPFGNALPDAVLRDGTVVGVPMVYMSPSVALRQPLLRFTRDGIVRDTLNRHLHRYAVRRARRATLLAADHLHTASPPSTRHRQCQHDHGDDVHRAVEEQKHRRSAID